MCIHHKAVILHLPFAHTRYAEKCVQAGILCMFCGTVESLPNEADKSLFAIGGGDFAPLLQKPEKKLQLLVSRETWTSQDVFSPKQNQHFHVVQLGLFLTSRV